MLDDEDPAPGTNDIPPNGPLISLALDRLGPWCPFWQQPQIGPELNHDGGPNNGAQEQVAQPMDADLGWAPWPNNEFQVPIQNLNDLPPTLVPKLNDALVPNLVEVIIDSSIIPQPYGPAPNIFLDQVNEVEEWTKKKLMTCQSF